MDKQTRIKVFPHPKPHGGDNEPLCKCKEGQSTAELLQVGARAGPTWEGRQARSSHCLAPQLPSTQQTPSSTCLCWDGM